MNPVETIPEFGIKREHEERRDGGCGVVFDPQSQKYAVGQLEHGLYILFSGGVNPEENIKAAILREVTEESGLHDFLYVEQIAQAFTHYHNELKKVNRVAFATCFLAILKSTAQIEVKLEAHEKFSLQWATAEEVIANWNTRNHSKDYDHWIYFLTKAAKRAIELGYDTTSSIT